MSRIILASMLALLPLMAFGDINDILNSTCLVNNWGTGSVFAEDKTHYWIITAGHCVVDEDSEPLFEQDVVFFHDGTKSDKIKSELVWHVLEKNIMFSNGMYKEWVTDKEITKDLALLKIKKSDLKNYPAPETTPIANLNEKIKKNQIVVSSGCPNGGWPTAFKARVYQVNDHVFKFSPFPKRGRSGSGIYDEDGERLLGVVVANTGATVPIWKIWKLTRWAEEKGVD